MGCAKKGGFLCAMPKSPNETNQKKKSAAARQKPNKKHQDGQTAKRRELRSADLFAFPYSLWNLRGEREKRANGGKELGKAFRVPGEHHHPIVQRDLQKGVQ